jgi:methionyl aminopeptidase
MIKRPEEIVLMAESGKLLAQVFGYLDGLDLIGMSTMQVNDLVDSYIVDRLGARPASKGQYGFAYSLNSSRNNVVCHGVPSTTDVLRRGYREFRYHAGKARLHRRFQQDLPGR